MKKLSSFGSVAFAVLVAGLAMVGFSAPAQAYPEAQVDLQVNRDSLYSEQKFEATASSDLTCNWTLEWHGTKREGQSYTHHDFRTSFTAPAVTSETRIRLRGTCSYTAENAPQNARGATTAERTVEITVLPKRSEVSPPKSGVEGPKSGAAGPKSGVAGPKAAAAGPKPGAPAFELLR